ncbi:hypothetical protein SL264_19690 [Enterobacter cloacae]|nr:hypothetical protein SL264_19690 [Enterobacter cloacae]BCZ62188.1 hypothetical protein SL269_19720 [Klebsiella aerogenes]
MSVDVLHGEGVNVTVRELQAKKSGAYREERDKNTGIETDLSEPLDVAKGRPDSESQWERGALFRH